jgi:Fe-S oxidoreductase/FAD/FMN-containing dehydrogenase
MEKPRVQRQARRSLEAGQARWLEELFGGRATFSPRELRQYGHDVGALPGLIKPLLGSTQPAAVVQPVSEGELVELARWAAAEGLPLVPRGRSTSGYGGVLPVRGGIVVDFARFTEVLDVQRDRVTVQAGITWKKLDERLRRESLTLCLYPSSYPSSTVGGWLAQGGAGFGSWKYGWFAENVSSARAVLGDGTVQVFQGSQLRLVSEAEGITGLITQVTLRVRPAGQPEVMLADFDSAERLGRFLASLEGLDLWSVSFTNPTMARLANQAPLRTHHGQPVHERVVLPERYLATLAWFPGSNGQGSVAEKLAPRVEAAGGRLLARELAEHEWEERFHLMRIKRLGPSLVPAEVVVPLAELPAVLEELERRVRQPLALEGMGVSGREAVLLGFIPHDQRRLGFNLAFALSLTVTRAAKQHGGRAYSTGLYFASEAPGVLGAGRLAELAAFKAQADPRGILNPGKVLSSRLAPFMGLASRFEPLLRPLANLARIRPGERIGRRPVRGIPPETAWYAYACSGCGYCVDECDQYYGRMWESQSPRGKWFFLRELLEGREKLDQQAVDTFLVCTTCELCNVLCSEGLPIEPSWMGLRGLVVEKRKKMTIPAFEVMAASLDGNLNIWANYRRERDAWLPEEVKPAIRDRADTLYFAGCTASLVEKDIARSAARLLHDAGIEFAYLGKDEACCGIPMLVAGKWGEFAKVVRHNLGEAAKRGAKKIITSCPACWLSWAQLYKEWAAKLGIPYEVEVQHYSEALAPAVASGKLSFQHTPKTVTWHDSCHIGRAGGVYEPPRELIKAIPGVELREMEHNREQAHCCGSVLSLISEPEVAHRIGKVKLEEAVATGAEELLSLCPCCQFQLRVSAEKNGMPVKVTDLATFAAKARGYQVEEDLPMVLDSWATFEAMIALLKPPNMAGLMQELFPELVEAMPGWMGRMMCLAGRLGLLPRMKGLFPLVFPLLMPGMMPKLMPAMLQAVARRVPMPGYMQEQMPELMPRAMGNLMPHLLPQVVPLIAQPLVDFLVERCRMRRRRPAARKGEAPAQAFEGREA